MYIPETDHGAVLSEIHRALKPGGELLIWDTAMPGCHGGGSGAGRKWFLLPLTIELPGAQRVDTGYGVLNRRQNAETYAAAARKLGFLVVSTEEGEYVFFLRLRRE